MALLTSPDMIPEAMRFLVRTLLALGGGPVPREELIELVAPPGLAEAMQNLGGSYTQEQEAAREDEERSNNESDDEPDKARTGGQLIATQSLRALITLQMAAQEKRNITLLPHITAQWKKPTDVTPAAFREVLLNQIFYLAKPNSEQGDDSGINDLIQALELIYSAENPLRPFVRFEPSTKPGRSFQALQTSAFGNSKDQWPVRNPARWPPFCRWSFYLGLTSQAGSGGVIADASSALKVRLARLPKGTYDASTFVERCAEAVPLLDGGTLQAKFVPETTGSTRVLSPALSLSLMQLEADGLARFEVQSDTGVCVIRLRADRSADRSITSVEWVPDAEEWSGA